MPQLTPYVTATVLRAALSPPTYKALFDDDQIDSLEDIDVSTQVLLVLRRAHARVVSRLPVIYTTLPTAAVTANIPALLEDAELCYAEALSYDRHPEYSRQYGRPKFVEGDEIMERVQAAVLKIADNPPEPEPANVGGFVTDSGQRVFLGYTNGVLNSGDF